MQEVPFPGAWDGATSSSHLCWECSGGKHSPCIQLWGRGRGTGWCFSQGSLEIERMYI